MAKRNTLTKPQRGLDKAVTSARARARRAVVAEQRKHRSQVTDQLRAEAQRAQQQHDGTDSLDEGSKRTVALMSIVMPQEQAVADSHGLDVPIRWSANSWGVRAYTDFKEITVKWSPQSMSLDNPRNVMLGALTLRGICQHEIGHNLFSVKPSKIASHPSTKALMEALDPPVPVADLMHVQNVLEDQRMECRMVQMVPRLDQYFTVMVTTTLTKVPEERWVLTAGRSYLPQAMLDEDRQNFGDADAAHQWELIVHRYKVARSVKAMVEATIEAHQFLKDRNSHRPDSNTEHETVWQWDVRSVSADDAEAMDEQIADSALDGPAPDAPAPSVPDTAQDGSESAQDGSDGQSGDDGDDEATTSSTGVSEHSSNVLDEGSDASAAPTTSRDADDDLDGETDQDVQDPQAAREEQMRKDQERRNEAIERILDNERDEYEEMCGEFEHRVDNYQLPTLPTAHYPMLNNQFADLGNRIAERMRMALQKWVTAAAPVWQSRQEQGVLDPLAWRTHRAGERDFYRDLDASGAEGLDVHVSLMCDVSASMVNHMQPLSALLYGAASACDALGIDRTFTVWADDRSSFRLWEQESPAPVVLDTLGGTDPHSALDDCLSHNVNGRSRHLVIVFTDGAWGRFSTLQNWADDGRSFLLIKFGPDAPAYTYGADTAVHISAVEDMEYQVSAAIDDVLSELY